MTSEKKDRSFPFYGAGTGYLAALVATFIWAGNFVAARALANAIPPFQFNFWRWVVAFLALLPFAARHLGADWQIAKKHFGYLSIMALLGVTLMNTFVYKAGQSTSSLNMALIMPATPALIMVLARVVYGTPITRGRFAGLLVCLTGILILISGGDWHKFSHLDFAPGDIWTLGCMGCFALYSLFIKSRPREMSSLGFNELIFGLGILYSIPFTLAEMVLLPLPQPGWPLAWGILYAGVGCSAIAFWLWTMGIDRIGPVRAGFIYYSLPIFAAFMAKIVLDEAINSTQIIGGVLITLGIITATAKKGEAKPPPVRQAR